jgi:tetratricopeptide (TPR) repeat protein
VTETAAKVEYNASAVSILNNHAAARYATGDYNGTFYLLKLAFTLMKINEQCRCPDTQTKSTSNDLPTRSYIFQRMGYDEGLNTYDDFELIVKGTHPDAAKATLLFNAGQARRRLEDDDGASHLYQRALRILLPSQTASALELREPSSASATVHSESLHAIVMPLLHNAGRLAYRQGSAHRAILHYEIALYHAISLNGSTDLSVGMTLNCLGVMLYHSGPDGVLRSMKLFQQALQILIPGLGVNSTLVAAVYNNMGRVLFHKEEFGAAFGHYEKALLVRRRILGRDHLDTAASCFNAAQSLHQQGEFAKAMDLYKEFLGVARLKLSKEHRDMALVLSGIAQIHHEQKEYGEALELFEESLRVGRVALGNYHPDVSMLYNRLGNFLFEQERYDEAMKAYKRGLRIERRVLTEAHPNIAVTLGNIGEIYRQQGRYSRSIQLYRHALRLQKMRNGVPSSEVAGTLTMIGLIHDQTGKPSKALSCLQRALTMKRSVHGDDHLEVASALMYLGSLLFRRRMISTSLRLFAEALRIRSFRLGVNNRDVSLSVYNFGLCHQLQGANKEAAACYRETLRIEKLLLGDSHKDVSITYSKLGEVMKAENDLEGALHNFENALRIEKADSESTTEGQSAVVRTLNQIGNLQMVLGNVAAMMEAFCEAARTAGSIESVTISASLRMHGMEFGKAAATA